MESSFHIWCSIECGVSSQQEAHVFLSCRLHINAYVSALAMIKEKVIKNIATDLTGWFASWSDDRKFHCIAGEPLWHSRLIS